MATSRRSGSRDWVQRARILPDLSSAPPLQRASSESDLPPLRRALPLARRVVVEDQRLVGGDHEPGAALDLALELARRPARVAGREHRAARPGAAGDGLEDRGIAGDRHPPVHDPAVAARPLGSVQHEAAPRLDRAAVVDADVTARAAGLAPERFQHARERQRADGTIHDETEGAGGVVAEHADDGARQAWGAEVFGGDEEPAGRAARREPRGPPGPPGAPR